MAFPWVSISVAVCVLSPWVRDRPTPADTIGPDAQAEQLQAAIRAKLQRLAPQQRKLQREVLQERSQAQVGRQSVPVAGQAWQGG